ncbi:oxaloacetate decarboxylase [Rhizobium johnstonii]|jgi:2-methylisocitrate lyase-like PEP mutase family enzyme|uniref:Isocitrate lyase/PEP mutase family protein n=3 Tax=Rhizobium TaxID=379 RepID=A0A8G2MTW6_RHILV|nr:MULTISPECIES: isocitrate lyase/PEP mutase family protein [Rhizobium]MBA1346611.1 isocitrate lyase/PEP mutase family protein [Rhizobium sp. WYCCWR 11146]MBB4510275.1 2-methylisocitrate lyase-like PEP mutase family enzyme [Rhizobium leguminosarum]MBY5324935.1 isocitrate lyase/PEP mutase family protein [Rhizobium leguminosarum]MBY5344965.1 isocitrate lyase/PEP mutase family protein [Rhizobium leguminosarum]MBY5378589.1 isocitrate lyase/PEP mutase family protein [Rhizobium leguminosarum]
MTMIGNREKVKFRDLVSRKQVFTPCVWDCYSAKAAEMAGFEAILLSGASLGFSMSGVPDLGLHNQEELVYATDRIADYSPLPLVIDADDGFGDVVQTFRTCYRLAKAGAGAILIEDTPNERGYARFGRAMEAATLAGKVDGNVPHEVVSQELWLAKIKASIEACQGSDCVVIARTESKLEKGLDDAIERCVRAAALGAEMTYVHGLRTLEECRKVAKELPGWKMFGDVATVNGVPFVRLEEIEALGFNLVTMHYLEKGSMYGMMDYGRHVFKDRSTRYADEHSMGGMTPAEQKASLERDSGWLDAEDRWKAL